MKLVKIEMFQSTIFVRKGFLTLLFACCFGCLQNEYSSNKPGK